MAKQWELRIHPVAIEELREMKRCHPDQLEEVQEVLAYLQAEDDPRKPKHRRLNVCAVRWDAPGWYRVRSLRLNLRIVYRVLETRDGRVIEINNFRNVHEEAGGHIIQIMQAAERAAAYGPVLRERRKKVA